MENYFYLQLPVHYERYINYLTFRKVQSDIVTIWKPRSNGSKEKIRWLAFILSTHYHILTHYEFTSCFFNKNSFSRYLKQNVITKSDKHMLPCFKRYNGTIESQFAYELSARKAWKSTDLDKYLLFLKKVPTKLLDKFGEIW